MTKAQSEQLSADPVDEELRIRYSNQGYRAFKAGHPEDANPYRAGGLVGYWWNAGWIDALSEAMN